MTVVLAQEDNEGDKGLRRQQGNQDPRPREVARGELPSCPMTLAHVQLLQWGQAEVSQCWSSQDGRVSRAARQAREATPHGGSCITEHRVKVPKLPGPGNGGTGLGAGPASRSRSCLPGAFSEAEAEVPPPLALPPVRQGLRSTPRAPEDNHRHQVQDV